LIISETSKKTKKVSAKKLELKAKSNPWGPNGRNRELEEQKIAERKARDAVRRRLARQFAAYCYSFFGPLLEAD
jgi:hypothetical protein